MTGPKLLLILTENWTMRPAPDVADLVGFAVEAERAGIDGVMVSEHVVLGPSADAAGRPENPRDYALPGNQDPASPWPSPIVLLSAVAAATSRIRLVAGAIISPLRHPLALAKDLATLDRLSGGRLVVQPTVSWHRDEYAALGVPFGQRGEILDEQLEVWAKAWGSSPVAHEGNHFSFGKMLMAVGSLRSFAHSPGRVRLVVCAVVAIAITAGAIYGSFYKVTSPTILAPWFALIVLVIGFASTFVTRARRSASSQLPDLTKSTA